MAIRHRILRGVMFFLFVELCLQAVSFGWYVWTARGERQALHDRVRRMWAYRDPLYAAIDREESALIEEYQPFVGWRTGEAHDAHINVDSDGVRRTLGNPVATVSGLPALYFFGGSAMWGVGHADETTIPSFVATRLNRTKPRVKIVNYGEIGYGSTQEVMLLLRVLMSGKRPDYVVFYHGCNDLFLTGFDDVPHETFRDTTIRERLGNIWALPREGTDAVSNTTIFSEALWKDIFSHIQLIRYPMELYISKKPQPVAPRQSTEQLTDILVQNYVRNIEIVGVLSQAYGFEYLFLFQPTLYSREECDMTDDEKQLPDATDARFGEFASIYTAAAQQIAREYPEHFVSTSTIFDGMKESIFTDSCHVTPRGNQIVSEKILELLRTTWVIE